ncbi:hypothetical protein L6V77_22210 [Myxococcota bacterium]|nr:hypothetical protein [Myxococcota bacterium]
MRTLILSDLHIGLDTETPLFSGGGTIRTAIEAEVKRHPSPLRLVLNGDTFDLLLDPKRAVLNVEGAAARMSELLTTPDARALLDGLRAVLTAGGEVVVRPGNHDLELVIPEVADVVRAAIGVDPRRVELNDRASQRLQVGQSAILVAHGEGPDAYNWFDYSKVREGQHFKYPPGSQLVVDLLNPLKWEEGLRFLDILMPDFHGAVLTALAVRPSVLPRVRAFLPVAWRRLLRTVWSPHALANVDDAASDLRAFADLGPTEMQQLHAFLNAPEGLVAEISDIVGSKLLRAGLYTVAAAHRRIAGDAGEAFFSLMPGDDEWRTAESIAEGNEAVVFGHTHARRCARRRQLAYINSGTWARLMRLPPADGPARLWQQLLLDLREDPGLTGRAASRVETIASGVRIAADDAQESVTMSLLRWQAGDAAWTLEPDSESLDITPQAYSLLVRPAVAVAAGPAERRDTAFRQEVGNRVDRLRDEIERAGADRGSIPGVLRAGEHRAALATTALELVTRVEQLVAGLGVAHRPDLDRSVALQTVLQAESTWALSRAIADQRRGQIGWLIEMAESIVVDGYNAVYGEARMRRPDLPKTRAPVPLVFLQAGHSPATWARGATIPAPGLTRQFASLPFPVVIVPPEDLARPWRLALALHEVGHDLVHDLELHAALVNAMKLRPAQNWWRWLHEILADVIGLRLAGPVFLDAADEVLTALVGESGGWSDDAVHPPVALRLAIVAHLAGDGARQAAFLAADEKACDLFPEAETFLHRLLTTPLPEYGGAILAELVPETRAVVDGTAQSWRELPNAVFRSSGADPQRAVSALTAIAAPLSEMRPAWHASLAVREFEQKTVPTLAPTLADQITGFKRPPIELLREFHTITFVGATNGQLAGMVAEARKAMRADHKWHRVEIFFLDDARLKEIATEDRPFAALRYERDVAMADLRASLQECAESWSLYTYSQSPVFVSLWTSDHLRHVHASSRLWGMDIRVAPSIDRRVPVGVAHREVDAYFEAVENLRRDAGLCECFASSDDLRT